MLLVVGGFANRLSREGRTGRRLNRQGCLGVELPARRKFFRYDGARAGLGAPCGEIFVGLGLADRVILLEGSEHGIQFSLLHAVFGTSDQHGRRVVGVIAVEGGHRSIPEERGHGVEFLLADRVKLVVMAGRATAGEPQPNCTQGLDLILGVIRHDLFGDGAAFTGRG